MSQATAAKIDGALLYASDAVPPRAALVGIVRSPYPHARIVSVDTSAALRTRGVLGALVPDDFGDYRMGHPIADEPVLAHTARYVGDHVAAIAADSADALRAGVSALRVEYEVLPPILNTQQALRSACAIHGDYPDNVAYQLTANRGDWQQAVGKVASWAEGTFEIDPVQHAYMEPRACVALYEPGRLTLIAPSHFPAVMLEDYRRWTEAIPGYEHIEVRTPAIGGSFGAKWHHPTHLICLEFAHRLKRSVALTMSRRDDMVAGRSRVGMRVRMRIGATSTGRLVAKETEIEADNGAYSLHGPPVLAAALTRMDNLYRFEATRAQGKLVYTTKVPSECFRGFGSPQSAFAQEQLIDDLAIRLSLTPVEIRRRNAIRVGDTTVHGWRIRSSGLGEALDWIEEQLAEDQLEDSAAAARSGTAASRRYASGYGVAAGMHGISNRGYDPTYEGASVRLRLREDGVLVVHSPEVEVGAGTVEVLGGLVAEGLGLPRDEVHVDLGSTADSPYGLGSYASRTSFFAGHAALKAVEAFREKVRTRVPYEHRRIREALDRALGDGSWRELDITAEYVPDSVEVPDHSRYGNISPSYTFAAHACKVLVDRLTGQTTVVKYWAAHDAGRILFPQGAAGQVYGGVAQGVGHALYERVMFGNDGEVQNAGFLDDRIPTPLDMIDTVVHFTNTVDPVGPHGAKTIAEIPLIPTLAAVGNAIHSALGKRIRSVPMTPERVAHAIDAEDEAEKDNRGG